MVKTLGYQSKEVMFCLGDNRECYGMIFEALF